MNALSHFRLVEEPLGADALERPSRDEWQALWDSQKNQPVPDYSRVTLRRFGLHPRR